MDEELNAAGKQDAQAIADQVFDELMDFGTYGFTQLEEIHRVVMRRVYEYTQSFEGIFEST